MAAAKKSIVVVLDVRNNKEKSVRFETEDGQAFVTNVYVKNAGVEQLGDPQKVKVTVEAA
jgi:hypothetical protein